MSKTIILHRKPDQIDKSLTLCLKQQEGYELKGLIKDKHPGSYGKYCGVVGITQANFHAIMSGDRVCSIDLLERILSGIGYEVQVSFTIVIQEIPTGASATTASFATVDEEFALDRTVSEPTIKSDQSDYSLLERLLEQQKTSPESRFREDQEEF